MAAGMSFKLAYCVDGVVLERVCGCRGVTLAGTLGKIFHRTKLKLAFIALHFQFPYILLKLQVYYSSSLFN